MGTVGVDPQISMERFGNGWNEPLCVCVCVIKDGKSLKYWNTTQKKIITEDPEQM